jgi:hypothetical protein
VESALYQSLDLVAVVSESFRTQTLQGALGWWSAKVTSDRAAPDRCLVSLRRDRIECSTIHRLGDRDRWCGVDLSHVVWHLSTDPAQTRTLGLIKEVSMTAPTPAKSNPIMKILATIGAIVVACCLLSIGGVGFMRLMGPRVSTAIPPQTATARPVIGATVEYHAPTGTPQPTADKAGSSRDNPYPMNTVVDIGGGMKLSVVFVKRPADEIVLDKSFFVDTPTPEQEYIIVALHVDCTKSTKDKCNFSTFQLKTVGRDGKVYDQTFVSSVQNSMEPGNEFFGGGSIEGNVIFKAIKGDTSTVLFYDPLIFGDSIYISLQQE